MKSIVLFIAILVAVLCANTEVIVCADVESVSAAALNVDADTSTVPPSLVHVDLNTRAFVDETGRSLFFHGVNVVYKVPPYHPTIDGAFDPQLSFTEEDMDNLKNWGMNVVRLYVAWPAVEPTLGNFNFTYLEVLRTIVRRLADRGMYAILDCHQDILSREFCGEGAPDFAIQVSNKSLPFPNPVFTDHIDTDPATGYPRLDQCLGHPFFLYYMAEQVGEAFQSLYSNVNGIGDEFGRYWATVAGYFRDEPNVLGYELLNEPWAGDIYGDPKLLEPGRADSQNLAPFYAKLNNTIRAVDPDHMIFFEPTVLMTQFVPAGFEENPVGGSETLSKSVFSWHAYCADINRAAEPKSRAACDALDLETFMVRERDQDRYQVAGFVTEFGALYNDELSREEIAAITNLADGGLLSWTYWQFKGFNDITTQTHDHPGDIYSAEGFYDHEGALQAVKVQALSRTYAQAVAGVPISMSFNEDSSAFQLMFRVNKSISLPTVIFFNEQFRYSLGYTVELSPLGWGTFLKSDTNTLFLYPTSACPDGATVKFNLTPNTPPGHVESVHGSRAHSEKNIHLQKSSP